MNTPRIIRAVASLALLSLLAACGGAQQVALAPSTQALWDRCEPSVARYCHEHSHGSPPHEARCMRDEREAIAAQPDDATRSAYLRQHGCAQ